jgi:hypothetical protein
MGVNFKIRLVVGVEVPYADVWETVQRPVGQHILDTETLYHPKTGAPLWRHEVICRTPFVEDDYGRASLPRTHVCAFPLTEVDHGPLVLGVEQRDINIQDSLSGALEIQTLDTWTRLLPDILTSRCSMTVPMPKLYYIPYTN